MNPVTQALQGLSIGEPQHFRNLTAFPLLNPAAGKADYVTLSEAVVAGSAQITEVSEGGSVPHLMLANRGDTKVLILDGEELIGAKQNRIANLTILADARSETMLPVSCVEHGRWSYRSRDFQVSPRAMFHRARAAKADALSRNLKATGTYGADQGQVWDNIAAKQSRMRVDSPTSAMSDMFDSHEERVEDYAQRFRAVEHQVGVVFAIDGTIEGMDLFDAHGTLGKMLPKLSRSFAIDALESRPEQHREAEAKAAEVFLDRVAAAGIDSYPGVGIGTDLRLEAPLVAGGGLAEGDKLIHLAAFATQRPAPRSDRMESRESRLHSARYNRMRNRNRNRGGE